MKKTLNKLFAIVSAVVMAAAVQAQALAQSMSDRFYLLQADQPFDGGEKI